MDDNDVLSQISRLVDEEHRLLRQRSAGAIGREGHRRLEELQVQLDQCWDYLRQRRGARHAGREPSRVGPRDPETVEHYEQ